MEVTDQAKAREALTVLGVVLFAQVGISLLMQVAPSLMSTLGGAESFYRYYAGQQLLWLLATLATMVALFLLSRAVKEPDLLYALLGGCGLIACFELYWAYVWLAQESGMPLPSIAWLGYVSMAANLGVNLGLCFVIGKLGRVTAFAAGIGVFFVLRSLLSFGMQAREEHGPIWVYSVLSLFGIAASVALGALALYARKVVSAPPGGAIAFGEAAPVTDPSGMRLVLTGVALLVLGVGGTALSYSAASGGGRYIVATGAIVTGLFQLVRGLGRITGGK